MRGSSAVGRRPSHGCRLQFRHVLRTHRSQSERQPEPALIHRNDWPSPLVGDHISVRLMFRAARGRPPVPHAQPPMGSDAQRTQHVARHKSMDCRRRCRCGCGNTNIGPCAPSGNPIAASCVPGPSLCTSVPATGDGCAWEGGGVGGCISIRNVWQLRR